jgi:hypothetical protein
VCSEIDPNNKEEMLSQYHQSDTETDYLQLLVAIKKLLSHGNIGRLVGFPLLKSALEVFITREISILRKVANTAKSFF